MQPIPNLQYQLRIAMQWGSIALQYFKWNTFGNINGKLYSIWLYTTKIQDEWLPIICISPFGLMQIIQSYTDENWNNFLVPYFCTHDKRQHDKVVYIQGKLVVQGHVISCTKWRVHLHKIWKVLLDHKNGFNQWYEKQNVDHWCSNFLWNLIYLFLLVYYYIRREMIGKDLPRHQQGDHDNQSKGQMHSSDHHDEPERDQ